MKEFVCKFKKGDVSAFSILVNGIKKRLYVIAKARLKVDADVEDAMQEALIKVYDEISTLKDDSKFEAWATKILINECNKIIKKKRNNCSYEDINAEYYLSEKEEENAVNNSLDFFSIISSLDIEDRTIIAMYYTDEYTTKEIGNILNLNENTVKSKIKRAKETMKKIYDKEEKSNGWIW